MSNHHQHLLKISITAENTPGTGIVPDADIDTGLLQGFLLKWILWRLLGAKSCAAS
jgi:hypothetical protein